MKLCNTQRDILYRSYIIGNTVCKAPTQEGVGGCRTATTFQIEIKRHKFNRLEEPNFDVIYPRAEISHWHRLMTNKMESWKIRFTYDILQAVKEQRILYLVISIRWVNRGTCTYVVTYLMCIKSVANNVMLQLCLWNNFRNLIFKIKYKFYV